MYRQWIQFTPFNHFDELIILNPILFILSYKWIYGQIGSVIAIDCFSFLRVRGLKEIPAVFSIEKWIVGLINKWDPIFYGFGLPI